MESLGIKCPHPSSFPQSRIGVNDQLGIKKQNVSFEPMQITRASASASIVAAPSLVPLPRQKNKKEIRPEKLDEWITDSVSEIVRHIGEAPFLVHVYSSPKTTRLELEREKAKVSSWPAIKKRWEEGCPIPDGVILVEQLDEEQVDEDEDDASGTRKWGVVIQGRGVDIASCYILKTCRVGSSLGFCTHFCLLKAKCFGDAAELQLQSSWNN